MFLSKVPRSYTEGILFQFSLRQVIVHMLFVLSSSYSYYYIVHLAVL